MKKVGLTSVVLSFTLFFGTISVNADNLYSVDSNGNWVYTPSAVNQPQQSSQSYETTRSVSTPIYNKNNNNNNYYNGNSYSYSTNTYNQQNSQNSYTTTAAPTSTGFYNTNPMSKDDDVPYSIRVEKAKQPFNVNLSVADLNTMVNKIGDKLVNSNRINKNVKFIVNSGTIVNATTGITNNITVYKGLREYCENEDELAFVIGHELGHATSSHVLKTYGINVTTGIASEYAKMKLSEKIGNKWGRWATNIAIDQTTGAVQNKISRGQEKDADLLSIDYVVAAGYNPLAGISIMNKIGNNYADFWSDHPSTDKRVISMYKYIKEKYPDYLEQGFDTYSYKQALSNYVR